MNTTTKFFATKEQYLAFRKAFAAAQNDSRAKKSFVETETYIRDGKGGYVKGKVKVRQSGWLSSTYFLLFNLACGRPFYNGFTPKTKASFIDAGGDPDRALTDAIKSLKWYVDRASYIFSQTGMYIPSYIKDKKQYINEQVKAAQADVTAFLELFAGTITTEQLSKLQLPNIITTDGKTKTYAEIIEDKVVEQMSPVAVTNEIVESQTEKKGFFKSLFGG